MEPYPIPDDFDDYDDNTMSDNDDDEEGADICVWCGSRQVDATAENNDVRLAVCASCASGYLLSMLLRAIAAGANRRGGTEAEHKRVMNMLQRDYRYAAGLPDENGFLAMLERNKARRPQGNG